MCALSFFQLYHCVRLGTPTSIRPEMYVRPSTNLLTCSLAFADAKGRNTYRYHLRGSIFVCAEDIRSIQDCGGDGSAVADLSWWDLAIRLLGRRPSFFDLVTCSSTLLHSPLLRTRARRCFGSLFYIFSRGVVPIIPFHLRETMSTCQPDTRHPAS